MTRKAGARGRRGGRESRSAGASRGRTKTARGVPRGARGRDDESSGSEILRLRRVLGLVSLALLAAMGTTLLLTSSFFGIREILVVGSSHLPSKEIVTLCGVAYGENILRIHTGRVRDRIAAHPRVETVTVSRRLPDRLVVNVVERTGVALVPVRERYVEIDARGRPLEMHRFIGALGLPVITGLEIDGITLGVALRGEPLMGALGCAEMLGQDGRARIAEINVSEGGEEEGGGGAGGAMTLYTREGVPVYLGTTAELAVKAEVLNGILLDIEAKAGEVSYIDIRYPRYPIIGAAAEVFRPQAWPDPDAVLIGEP